MNHRDNESGMRRLAMMTLRHGFDPSVPGALQQHLPDPSWAAVHQQAKRQKRAAKERATMSKTSTPVNALFQSTTPSNGQGNPATDPAAFLAAKAASGPVGECGITAAQFLADAKPITVIVNGQTLIAYPKAFSTGSFGYYLGEKAAIEVCGRPVRLQLGMNATVIGSNPSKASK